MKRRFLRWIGALLTMTLCAVLLTGCGPSYEERAKLTEDGHELLTQALLEGYGWESNEYLILSVQVTPSTADGFSNGEYRLKKGDTEFTALVDISHKEVFTDYYGEEFGEVLLDYLKRKMESSPSLQDISLQINSVTAYPPIFDWHFSRGRNENVKMIPATVTPEGFEAYLESCEQDGSLIVDMKTAWYSKEMREMPEDLLKTLSPKGKLPKSLIIEHYSCEPEELEQWRKLEETFSFYND